MHDLKQELKRTADEFGAPGVKFEDVRRVSSRRNGIRRASAAAVALIVAVASGSFLIRAFDDNGNVAGAGVLGVENGPISYIVGRVGGRAEGVRFAIDPGGDALAVPMEGWPQSWSPGGSTLAFILDPIETPDGDMSIWTVRSDGTDTRQLTDGSGGDYGVQWSPDGSHILFFRNQQGNRPPRLMVMNAFGSDVERIAGTGDQVFFTAVWSPDGSQILTVRDEEGSKEGSPLWLAVMNADGSHERVLVRGFLSQPSWSSDGSQVFYYSEGAVHTVSVTGSHAQTVIDGIDPQGQSVFQASPDGTRILFTQPIGFDEGEELWIAEVDGSDLRRIAEGLHWREPSPTWSPDGSAIAFVRDGDIWTIDIQTGDQSQVTDTLEHETWPAWAAA